MYDTFMQGKDLYSEIAAASFHKTYEECLEHFPKGTPIKKIDDDWFFSTSSECDKFADGETDTYHDGKLRRGRAKKILLGTLYGMEIPRIAEDLKCSVEEAKEIKNSVFQGFPAIKKFEDDSIRMAKELGYVTTICGRKRRLPDMQLPEFELRWAKDYVPEGDILDFDEDTIDIPLDRHNYYMNKLHAKWVNVYKLKEEAKAEHIEIVDNRKKIADATRQCVNARIQGTAAELTKLAMIKLSKNDHLRELGFRMLIPIHDELIVECPLRNAKECKELLAKTMSQAAEEILEMPISCDVTCSYAWYGEEIEI